MKLDFSSRLLITFSLLTISLSSYADQWYHVEFIVFEQLETVTDEQWPQMPVEEQKELLLPEMENQLIQTATLETLVGASNRLNRSTRYRVHYHQAWQQPIMKKHRAKAVSIHSDDDMINGSLRLYKSTYLHAALDLWLLENKALINTWSDVSPDGENIDAIRNPNLNESRRIRSKKLYFFDHPKLGALLELTPIETPIAVQENKEALETFSLPTEAAPTSTE